MKLFKVRHTDDSLLTGQREAVRATTGLSFQLRVYDAGVTIQQCPRRRQRGNASDEDSKSTRRKIHWTKSAGQVGDQSPISLTKSGLGVGDYPSGFDLPENHTDQPWTRRSASPPTNSRSDQSSTPFSSAYVRTKNTSTHGRASGDSAISSRLASYFSLDQRVRAGAPRGAGGRGPKTPRTTAGARQQEERPGGLDGSAPSSWAALEILAEELESLLAGRGETSAPRSTSAAGGMGNSDGGKDYDFEVDFGDFISISALVNATEGTSDEYDGSTPTTAVATQQRREEAIVPLDISMVQKLQSALERSGHLDDSRTRRRPRQRERRGQSDDDLGVVHPPLSAYEAALSSRLYRLSRSLTGLRVLWGVVAPSFVLERPLELQTFPALQELRLEGIPLEHIEGLFSLRLQLKRFSYEHAPLVSLAALLAPHVVAEPAPRVSAARASLRSTLSMPRVCQSGRLPEFKTITGEDRIKREFHPCAGDVQDVHSAGQSRSGVLEEQSSFRLSTADSFGSTEGSEYSTRLSRRSGRRESERQLHPRADRSKTIHEPHEGKESEDVGSEGIKPRAASWVARTEGAEWNGVSPHVGRRGLDAESRGERELAGLQMKLGRGTPSLRWSLLEELSVSRCGLRELDASLRLLPRVRRLSVTHNRLSEVDFLQDCLALEELDLSYNHIESLEGIHRVMGNLRSLNIHTNRISSTAGLERVFSLEEIDVSNNDIRGLEQAARLASLPLLRGVRLAGNPLEAEERKNYRVSVLSLLYQGREGELERIRKFASAGGGAEVAEVPGAPALAGTAEAGIALDGLLPSKKELGELARLQFERAEEAFPAPAFDLAMARSVATVSSEQETAEINDDFTPATGSTSSIVSTARRRTRRISSKSRGASDSTKLAFDSAGGMSSYEQVRPRASDLNHKDDAEAEAAATAAGDRPLSNIDLGMLVPSGVRIAAGNQRYLGRRSTTGDVKEGYGRRRGSRAVTIEEPDGELTKGSGIADADLHGSMGLSSSLSFCTVPRPAMQESAGSSVSDRKVEFTDSERPIKPPRSSDPEMVPEAEDISDDGGAMSAGISPTFEIKAERQLSELNTDTPPSLLEAEALPSTLRTDSLSSTFAAASRRMQSSTWVVTSDTDDDDDDEEQEEFVRTLWGRSQGSGPIAGVPLLSSTDSRVTSATPSSQDSWSTAAAAVEAHVQSLNSAVVGSDAKSVKVAMTQQSGSPSLDEDDKVAAATGEPAAEDAGKSAADDETLSLSSVAKSRKVPDDGESMDAHEVHAQSVVGAQNDIWEHDTNGSKAELGGTAQQQGLEEVSTSKKAQSQVEGSVPHAPGWEVPRETQTRVSPPSAVNPSSKGRTHSSRASVSAQSTNDGSETDRTERAENPTEAGALAGSVTLGPSSLPRVESEFVKSSEMAETEDDGVILDQTEMLWSGSDAGDVGADAGSGYRGDSAYDDLLIAEHLELFCRQQVFNGYPYLSYSADPPCIVHPSLTRKQLHKITAVFRETALPCLPSRPTSSPAAQASSIPPNCSTKPSSVASASARTSVQSSRGVPGRIMVDSSGPGRARRSTNSTATASQWQMARVLAEAGVAQTAYRRGLSGDAKGVFTGEVTCVVVVTDTAVFVLDGVYANKDVLFKEAPKPRVFLAAPLSCLERTTIGFRLQKLEIHFNLRDMTAKGTKPTAGLLPGAREVGAKVSLVLLTRDRSRTINILQTLEPLASKARRAIKLPPTLVENRDGETLEAIAKVLSSHSAAPQTMVASRVSGILDSSSELPSVADFGSKAASERKIRDVRPAPSEANAPQCGATESGCNAGGSSVAFGSKIERCAVKPVGISTEEVYDRSPVVSCANHSPTVVDSDEGQDLDGNMKPVNSEVTPEPPSSSEIENAMTAKDRQRQGGNTRTGSTSNSVELFQKLGSWAGRFRTSSCGASADETIGGKGASSDDSGTCDSGSTLGGETYGREGEEIASVLKPDSATHAAQGELKSVGGTGRATSPAGENATTSHDNSEITPPRPPTLKQNLKTQSAQVPSLQTMQSQVSPAFDGDESCASPKSVSSSTRTTILGKVMSSVFDGGSEKSDGGGFGVEGGDGAVVVFQLLMQRWELRPWVAAPRTLVATKEQVALMDEDHSGMQQTPLAIGPETPTRSSRPSLTLSMDTPLSTTSGRDRGWSSSSATPSSRGITAAGSSSASPPVLFATTDKVGGERSRNMTRRSTERTTAGAGNGISGDGPTFQEMFCVDVGDLADVADVHQEDAAPEQVIIELRGDSRRRQWRLQCRTRGSAELVASTVRRLSKERLAQRRRNFWWRR